MKEVEEQIQTVQVSRTPFCARSKANVPEQELRLLRRVDPRKHLRRSVVGFPWSFPGVIAADSTVTSRPVVSRCPPPSSATPPRMSCITHRNPAKVAASSRSSSVSASSSLPCTGERLSSTGIPARVWTSLNSYVKPGSGQCCANVPVRGRVKLARLGVRVPAIPGGRHRRDLR